MKGKGNVANLPVREMVLYKHGVGFFRREGKLSAETVEMTFRQDEINDVLKSLVVIDRGDGQVLGVRYQTPPDIEAQMADSLIHLSDAASLRDLIRDLRGRRVELELLETRVRGRLVGLDLGEGDDPLADTLISILADEDEVQVHRLKTLRSLMVLDEQAAHDLTYFLDSSLREDLRRTVSVQLTPGKHRLSVSYVAPTPTWRVSYRVVAEGEGEEGGMALLQGWGLFDNRLGEDLDVVQVTLVAGQPISFIYDLYASRIPDRPIVEDEARVAPGPVEFEAEIQAKAARPADEAAGMGMRMRRMAAAPAAAMPAAEADAAAPAQAEGREAGEFFRYEVTAPVSVRRGESALVPILGTDVTYRRELLYNGAKLPHHPVAALRFTNDTGLTLERGPATIVIDGDYTGEAVVPFIRDGEEVYLAYAVELGIRVTERSTQRREMAGLSIREGYLLINEYAVHETTAVIENNTADTQTMTLAAPIRANFELYDTPDPDAETATHRRWQVPVDAHASAEFTRSERRLVTRHEQLSGLDLRRLQLYLRDKWLDRETFDALAGLLDAYAEIDAAEAEQAKLKAERGEVYERQTQLRENFSALKAEGKEGALRSRLLGQLEASEDRLEAIDGRLKALDGEIASLHERIAQTLKALSKSG